MFTTNEDTFYTLDEIQEMLGLDDYQMADFKNWLPKASWGFDLSTDMEKHIIEKGKDLPSGIRWYSWADITFTLEYKAREQR